MENPEEAFVDYASSRTDEARGKWYTFKLEQNNLGDTDNPSWKSHPNLRWMQRQNYLNKFSNLHNRFQSNGLFLNRSFNNNPQNFNQTSLEGLVSNFMASQDDKITRFEVEFIQHQGEITNKLGTLLKAFNDRTTRALPSDIVKNPKLTPNSTSSASSYPTRDPQSSFNSFKLVNAIQRCFKSTANIQKDQLQVNTLTVNEIETPKLKEPKESLKDEFAELHLNLPALKVLVHVPTTMPWKLKLFEAFHVVDMEREPTCPLLVGRGFLATANAVIDCKNAKIAVREGLTRSIFGVREIDFGEENVPYWTTIGKHESYKPRTSEDDIGTRPPYFAKRDFQDNHLPGKWEIARDTEDTFDEKKPGSSYEFYVDDSWMTI
nr:hypothetical protein [Tanacetum cinerariifolium]